jgi:hypothetical protein
MPTNKQRRANSIEHWLRLGPLDTGDARKVYPSRSYARKCVCGLTYDKCSRAELMSWLQSIRRSATASWVTLPMGWPRSGSRGSPARLPARRSSPWRWRFVRRTCARPSVGMCA